MPLFIAIVIVVFAFMWVKGKIYSEEDVRTVPVVESMNDSDAFTRAAIALGRGKVTGGGDFQITERTADATRMTVNCYDGRKHRILYDTVSD